MAQSITAATGIWPYRIQAQAWIKQPLNHNVPIGVVNNETSNQMPVKCKAEAATEPSCINTFLALNN